MSLPDSAADLSDRIVRCRLVSVVVVARNSCRDASCSLWKAANLFTTSALVNAGETLSLSLLLSLSSSLSLLLSLPVSLPLEVLIREVCCLLLLETGFCCTLLCFDVAIAIKNAIRVAAAAMRKIGDGPCCAPQSTLHKQGGGLIWAVWGPVSLGETCSPGYVLLGNVILSSLTGTKGPRK